MMHVLEFSDLGTIYSYFENSLNLAVFGCLTNGSFFAK